MSVPDHDEKVYKFLTIIKFLQNATINLPCIRQQITTRTARVLLVVKKVPDEQFEALSSEQKSQPYANQYPAAQVHIQGNYSGDK